MNPSKRLGPILATAVLALLLGAAPLTATAEAPAAFVQATSSRLLAALDALDATERQDMTRLGSLVEQHVVAHVDVPRLARAMLGRYAGSASARQLGELEPRLVGLLTRAYGAALKGLNDARIEVVRVQVSDDGSRAAVAVRVIADGARPLRVKHRLHRAGATWQLYDLEVEGVSLLTTYRRSFAAVLRDGDVDALIAHLDRIDGANT